METAVWTAAYGGKYTHFISPTGTTRIKKQKDKKPKGQKQTNYETKKL